MNGREWLSRRLIERGIGFERRDNCFTALDDVEAAQHDLDQQLKTAWARTLDRLLDTIHPSRQTMFGDAQLDYCWSADETEWATDVMFASAEELAMIYPRLARQALTTLGCGEVLRFLGKRPCVQTYCTAELLTHLGTREEGARVKHSHDRNSVKIYDKQGSVLRLETTINNPRQMKVYRTSENDPEGEPGWLPLRKGVADRHRRCPSLLSCRSARSATSAPSRLCPPSSRPPLSVKRPRMSISGPRSTVARPAR